MATASMRGTSANGSGAGKNRTGPKNETGEQRSLQIGSRRILAPSISISTVLWPIHVVRSPLAGAAA
jgi:hypothetical protein